MKARLHAAFDRIWNSPTLTTWMALGTRSLNLVVVLPLATGRLQPAEFTLWQLFVSVLTILMFLDLGLSPTFTRLFARAAVPGSDRTGDGAIDWDRVEAVWQTTRTVYLRLVIAAAVVMALGGTLGLRHAIAGLPDPQSGWLALGFLVLTAPLSLLSIAYASYLQGLNRVALLRRWEAITSVGSIATSLLILATGLGMLALVVGMQTWSVIALVRNRELALGLLGGRARRFAVGGISPSVWSEAWPAAWRSGFGVLIGAGFAQATGLIYARTAGSVEAGSYLLALRYLAATNQFSQAPFYSRIPVLARLQGQRRYEEMIPLARRGMRLSYLSFVFIAALLAFLIPFVLERTDGKIPFPDPRLWWLLVLGGFAERFGAMHLQLYSTTNKIRWHVANGVSGTIIIAATFAMLPHLGVYAFPLATLAGYLGYYVWYATYLSTREFGFNLWRFERTSALPAIGILGVIAGLHLLMSG